MISYIRGELVALEEDKAIVDVGGVGYGIFMSGQAMGQLPPVGSKVKIHTYLNIRAQSSAQRDMKTGAVLFSNVYGVLGMTRYGEELLARGREK